MSGVGDSSLVTVSEARRALAASPARATIKGRSWSGISIDKLSSYVARDLTAAPRDHHLLTINLADLPYVRSKRCGIMHEGPARFGEAAIIPADTASLWNGSIPPHITVRLSQDTLVELGTEVRGDRKSEARILNHFTIRDPFFEHIGALFSLELDRAPHPAQDVLVDCLATALLMHVLRGYSDTAQLGFKPSYDVSSASLRRALAYIDDQPHARISLSELAAVAGLSRFHFSRLFRKHVGMSPAAYIERSRIDRAKSMIKLGHMSLADIAYAVGFADQSHFSRRFRRCEGCSPSDYRRQFGH